MSAVSALRPRLWFALAAVVFTTEGRVRAESEVATPTPSRTEVGDAESTGDAPPADVALATPAETDAVASCLADHALGQEARMKSHLVDAAAMFTRCSDARCPEMVRADCAPWLAEVQAQVPRVSFEFAAGVRARDVHAFVDERPIDVLGIEPTAMDPGAHDFRFELEGHLAAIEHVVLLAGDPVRRIRIAFTKQPTPQPATAVVVTSRPAPRSPARHDTISPWTWVFGGVGALGFGVAAYFGISSLDEKARLRRQCAPLCNELDVETLQQRKLVADIGLGVGVLGAGVATAVYLLGDAPEPARDVAVSRAPNWQLYVAPSSVSLALEDRF